MVVSSRSSLFIVPPPADVIEVGRMPASVRRPPVLLVNGVSASAYGPESRPTREAATPQSNRTADPDSAVRADVRTVHPAYGESPHLDGQGTPRASDSLRGRPASPEYIVRIRMQAHPAC